MTPIFIVAAPRSGTTFLGEFLSIHPQVASWHEPYFIWQFKLKKQKNDYLTADLATEDTKKFIRKQFKIYASKSNKPILVEKTPVNAFKMEFINNVFPDAKWIHLYRDGRAVVNSLKYRYQRRYEIVKNNSVRQFLQDVLYTLKRQPFWRFRIMAIFYEIIQRNHILPYLTKDKHDIVFGPKYLNWEKDRKLLSDIEFMAKQWVESEEAIYKCRHLIANESIIDLRYEDLISMPESALSRICEHLKIDCQPYLCNINKIDATSKAIWQSGLTTNELDLISPIIMDTQLRLGFGE